MDSFEQQVEKVLSKPYLKNNRWYVKISFHSFGAYFETELYFKTQEEANKVIIGYEFVF